MNRRAVLLGLPSFLCGAAPAIVRAESLMPISVPQITLDDIYEHAVVLGGNPSNVDLLTIAVSGGSGTAYATLGNERRLLIGYGKQTTGYSTDFSLILVGNFAAAHRFCSPFKSSEAVRELLPQHRWRWHLLLG